jgi:hypothetical protein
MEASLLPVREFRATEPTVTNHEPGYIVRE